jgi:peroxiredoxin (alkyl hydroperoxide reductase subunit C)
MIGKKAPNIVGTAVEQGVVKPFSLADYAGKYVVLFFYPQDFTYVCPTELLAFQEKLADFTAHNVAIIGCSINTPQEHIQWLMQPRKEGGICGVTYPLLADTSREIARAYGVLDEDKKVAYRGLFILDANGIVQSMMINNMGVGRNIDEVLRIIEALEFIKTHGQVCPANWHEGQDGIPLDEQSKAEYFAKHAKDQK